MVARVDWAPDDSGFLTLLEGTAALCDASGAPGRPIAWSILDARWLADGRVLTCNPAAVLAWRTGDHVVDHRALAVESGPIESAAIAASGTAVATVNNTCVRVWSTAGEPLWRLDSPEQRDDVTTALSPSGDLVVAGHQSNHVGRFYSWVVGEVASDRTLATASDDPQSGPRRFAISDHRLRVAYSRPDHAAPAEVIELALAGRGLDGTEPRDVFTTAAEHVTAIAIDPSGQIAAFAFRKLRGRLCVAYLDPIRLATSEALFLDPDSPGDVAALAFSADSRRLACLGSDGRVEVVPVP